MEVQPPTPEERMIVLHDAYMNLEVMIGKVEAQIRRLWKEIGRLDMKIDGLVISIKGR